MAADNLQVKISALVEVNQLKKLQQELTASLVKAKALGDGEALKKFDGQLAAVNERLGSFSGLEKFGAGISAFTSKIPGLGAVTGVINGMMGPVTLALGGLTGALAAASKGIAEFAANQEKVAALDQTLANNGMLTDSLRVKLQNLAGAMQDGTAIAAGDWLKVMGDLVRLGGSTEASIERDTNAVKNLAGAIGMDLQTAASLYLKAMHGNFSALSRYGLKVDDSLSKQAKFNELLKQIDARGMGLLEARANTVNGKFQKLKNSVSDLWSALGRGLVSTGLVTGTADLLNGIAAGINKIIGGPIDKLPGLKNQLDAANRSARGLADTGGELDEFGVVAGANVDTLKKKLDEAARAADNLRKAQDALKDANLQLELGKLDAAEARDLQQASPEKAEKIKEEYRRKRATAEMEFRQARAREKLADAQSGEEDARVKYENWKYGEDKAAQAEQSANTELNTAFEDLKKFLGAWAGGDFYQKGFDKNYVGDNAKGAAERAASLRSQRDGEAAEAYKTGGREAYDEIMAKWQPDLDHQDRLAQMWQRLAAALDAHGQSKRDYEAGEKSKAEGAALKTNLEAAQANVEAAKATLTVAEMKIVTTGQQDMAADFQKEFAKSEQESKRREEEDKKNKEALDAAKRATELQRLAQQLSVETDPAKRKALEDRKQELHFQDIDARHPVDPSVRALLDLKNRNKNFVDRILNPDKYPVMDNGDGTHSTHRMASAEVDGRQIAYPTLFHDPKKNQLYAPDDAIGEALRTGNYIVFDSEEAARAFAEGGYKQGWGTGGQTVAGEKKQQLANKRDFDERQQQSGAAQKDANDLLNQVGGALQQAGASQINQRVISAVVERIQADGKATAEEMEQLGDAISAAMQGASQTTLSVLKTLLQRADASAAAIAALNTNRD